MALQGLDEHRTGKQGIVGGRLTDDASARSDHCLGRTTRRTAVGHPGDLARREGRVRAGERSVVHGHSASRDISAPHQ